MTSPPVRTEQFTRQSLWPLLRPMERIAAGKSYTWVCATPDDDIGVHHYQAALLATDGFAMLWCPALPPPAAQTVNTLWHLLRVSNYDRPVHDGGLNGVYVPAPFLCDALKQHTRKLTDELVIQTKSDDTQVAINIRAYPPPKPATSFNAHLAQHPWMWMASHTPLVINSILASVGDRDGEPYVRAAKDDFDSDVVRVVERYDGVTLGASPDPTGDAPTYSSVRMWGGVQLLNACKDVVVVPGVMSLPANPMPLLMSGLHKTLGLVEYYIMPSRRTDRQ